MEIAEGSVVVFGLKKNYVASRKSIYKDHFFVMKLVSLVLGLYILVIRDVLDYVQRILGLIVRM